MKIIFLISLIFFLFSCKMHSVQSVPMAFDYYSTNKEELKQNGFVAIEPNAGGVNKKGYSENQSQTGVREIYHRKLGDTSVGFLFEHDVLLEKAIKFNFEKFDSAHLFENIRQMGFIRTNKIKPTADYALYYPKNKHTYDVFVTKKSLVLVQVFTQREERWPAPEGVPVEKKNE